MKQTITNQLLTQSSIRARGWTIAQIRHFLGEPDQREASRLLWDASRVTAAEAKLEFRIWQVKREERHQQHQARKMRAVYAASRAIPAPPGFYEAIAQIRQAHTYLIGRPILPGNDGEAVIECPSDQYPRLAELLHIHEAHADFEQHGLKIGIRVMS